MMHCSKQEGGLGRRQLPERNAMSLGNPQQGKTPLGVLVMLSALVLAAILGASAGLIWEKSGWFSDDVEEEIVTRAHPGG